MAANPTHPPHCNFGINLATGATAGIIGTSVIYPIDIVKTRIQYAQARRTWLQVASEIVARDGIRGFYRGLAPNLLGVTPEKAIKLAVNDQCRDYFQRTRGLGQKQALPSHLAIASGAIAGACQVVSTNPMEMTKIQLQLATQDTSRPPPSLLQVVRQLGPRGLYRGSLATVSRDVPFTVIFFQVFHTGKAWFADQEGRTPFSFVFLSGFLAGGVGALMVTPLDVVKTRLQAAGREGRMGLLDIYRLVYRQEGIRAFGKGGVERALAIAPLSGIILLAYEVQRHLYQRYSLQNAT